MTRAAHGADDRPLRVSVGSVDLPGITELLTYAVGEDADRLDQAVRAYRDDSSTTLLIAKAGSDVVAVLGYTAGPDRVTVLHIATAPRARRTGIATGLLTELRRRIPPDVPSLPRPMPTQWTSIDRMASRPLPWVRNTLA